MRFLLEHAKQCRYAVPAFNVNDLQSVQATVGAAEDEDSPVILAATPAALEYGGVDCLSALICVAATKAQVPVAVHLDHGRSFEWAQACIRRGFSSVMIDASKMPFEENVARTKEVAQAGHAVDVTVEAELGRIVKGDVVLSAEQRDAFMTDPDEAARFVDLTHVDALAVAVGNAHGLYAYEPRLDLERLDKIARRTDAFLVLHGGSGTPRLPEAIALGVVKININADLQVAFRSSVKQTLDTQPLDSLYAVDILGPAREAMREAARAKIRQFGSAGHGHQMAVRSLGSAHDPSGAGQVR
jgi:fructose-bisphosphate aldolase class II